MKTTICIGLGGALGGGFRSLLNIFESSIYLGSFPLMTLLINSTGSLLIGFLVGWWTACNAASKYKWHFWITGFCGGYTTFSTFSYQILDLLRGGEGLIAGYYATCSIAFGLLAVWLGLLFAHRKRSKL